MYRAIHKYPMIDSTNRIQVPAGAEPIHFGVDPMGVMCMWALVDPGALPITKTYRVVGTGHQVIHSFMKYIGTAKVAEYMWHLFEDQSP